MQSQATIELRFYVVCKTLWNKSASDIWAETERKHRKQREVRILRFWTWQRNQAIQNRMRVISRDDLTSVRAREPARVTAGPCKCARLNN